MVSQDREKQNFDGNAQISAVKCQVSRLCHGGIEYFLAFLFKTKETIMPTGKEAAKVIGKIAQKNISTDSVSQVMSKKIRERKRSRTNGKTTKKKSEIKNDE